MTDYRPGGETPPPRDAFDERLDRLSSALERVRAAVPPPGDEVDCRLWRASELLIVLAQLTREIEERVGAHEWDAADTLAARVALDIYDEVLRELRTADRHARALIERSEDLFVEAADFAGHRWRRAERMEQKRLGA